MGGVRNYFFDGQRRLIYARGEVDAEEWFDYTETGFLMKSTTRVAAGIAGTSFATTEYVTNDFGQNVRRVDPNGANWSWTYNAAGQVRTETNPVGLITSYTFDKADDGTHTMSKSQTSDLPTPDIRWSLDDPAPSTATAAAGGAGNNGTYSPSGVTTGAFGAPATTPTTAPTFAGGHIEILKASLQGTGKTFALWFKTSGTEGGVLLSKNGGAPGPVPTGWNPMLYIGTDGKLRASDYPLPQIATTHRVNDGSWHLAILAVSASDQILYLDGNKIGTTAGAVNDTSWGYTTALIGTGYTDQWPGGVNGWMPFKGTIDDVRVWNRVIAETEFKTTATYGYTDAITPAYGNAAVRPPAWLINKTTDPLGRVTSFEFDAGGDLRKSVDAAGMISEYTYDAVGRRLTERQSADSGATWTNTVTNKFDLVGRLVQVDGPKVINPITYDDAGLTQSLTSSDIGGSAHPDLARTTSFHYDDASRRDRVTDALGYNTDTVYNSTGQAIKVTDHRGTVVETAVDLAGRETKVTLKNFANDPVGAPAVVRDVVTSETGSDPAGRVQWTKDAKGRVRATSYDTMGNPLRVDLYQNTTDWANGAVWKVLTTASYNLLSHPTQLASSGRLIDGAPVMTAIVDSSYDRLGRLASSTSRNTASNGGIGTSAGNTYDVTTSYTYDQVGNVTKTTAKGNGATSEIRSTPDVHNNPGTVTVENGAIDISTSTVRNKRGSVITASDALNKTVTTSYDPLGRPATVTLPAVETTTVDRTTGAATTATVAASTSRGYSTFGELTESKDAAGNVTKNTYDKLGRRTLITHPTYTTPDTATAVTPTEQFWFDEVGNLIKRRDRRGNDTSFDFDRRNRVIRQTDPIATAGATAGVSRFVYDDIGNLTSSVNQVGTTTQTSYDELDRVYSATEKVTVAGVKKDLTTSLSLDDAGRVLTSCAPAPTGQSRCVNTVYSPQGLVLSVQDAALNTTYFGYDGLGRQTKVALPDASRTETTYDGAGRAYQTQEFGNLGGLLATTITKFDAAGNTERVTGAGAQIDYEYNALGQLAAAKQLVAATPTAKTITTSYGYNALSQLT
jgi:YD repeat-containing protein